MDNSWSRKSHHLYSMSVLTKARGNSSLFDEDILMKQHLASISMILSSHKATPIVADLVKVRSLFILHGDTDLGLELVINVEFSGVTKRYVRALINRRSRDEHTSLGQSGNGNVADIDKVVPDLSHYYLICLPRRVPDTSRSLGDIKIHVYKLYTDCNTIVLTF